jgi:adenylate cyclase
VGFSVASRMPGTTDLDRLLDGLEGDARAARERLLRRLHEDGVTFDELERAVEEQRLILLPIERELRGTPKYTRAEMAAECEVDPEALDAVRRAAGLPVTAADAREFSEADVEAGRRLKSVLDAGMPLEGVVDANRVMGRALAQIAAAMRQMVGEAVLREAKDEDDAAERLVRVAQMLMPGIGPTMEHFFARHLLELIRSDVIDAEQLETGTIGGARETAVAFSDLVGFTRLGGRVPAEDLGAIARRLEALAADAIEPGTRLVKTIGDAVMLTAAEPECLLRSLVALSDAVDAEGEEFPQVRSGMAVGPAVERHGDLYGHAVNLASRITGIARPGSVLVSAEVRDAVDDGFRFSFAGERKVKGVGEVRLFRARHDGDESGVSEQ